MPVKGNFSALADIRRRVQGLASPAFRRDLATHLAAEAQYQAQRGFVEARDPYGKPWAPLTSREGRPLRDKGLLMNSLTRKPVVSEGGFTVSTDRVGAATHQYGATIRAKNAPYLVFRAGGARPRGHGRGATGGWVKKKQVTIPRRQFMPEDDLGTWAGPLADAATKVMLRHMETDF